MADEQARGHVTNSSRMLEEAFETGSAILSSMAGQRERLKVTPHQVLLSPVFHPMGSQPKFKQCLCRA